METAILAALDQRIEDHSKGSFKAPAEFLEAELRRLVNWYLVIPCGMKPAEATERFFGDRVKELEQEYRCYFERDEFVRNLKPSYHWKFTYAGCNAQIEYFLIENGLAAISEKLHLWPKTIALKELPDPLRRYFIGIGYFYPLDNQTLVVHPNLLFGQLGMGATFRTADSSFLTRDLIRCPYHVADYWGWGEEVLSDHDLWNYWKNLLALSIGYLPEYIHYRPEHLRGKEPLTKELKEHLELGRKFVPTRYVELEPKIDHFEWYFPPISSERFSPV